jgi:hypothetical protein
MMVQMWSGDTSERAGTAGKPAAFFIQLRMGGCVCVGVGVLVCWCVGVLVCWCVGVLVGDRIGGWVIEKLGKERKAPKRGG